MEKFLQWYRQYNSEITWFIIGFLFYAGLDDLHHHRYLDATFNLVLAFLNYKCYKIKTQ